MSTTLGWSLDDLADFASVVQASHSAPARQAVYAQGAAPSCPREGDPTRL